MAIDIRRVICGSIQENCYIVRAKGRDDCVVVDPGDEYPRLKAALGARRVGAVLLTHGHFDHILAAGRLQKDTGAPVYVASEDAAMLGDPTLNGLDSLMGQPTMDTPEIAPTLYGEALSVAGLDFEILPTPGHTRGSVCLYMRDAGVLFSGDTLFCGGFGRMDLPGGSHRDMRNSLRALFTLPEDVRVFPGHGPATRIGDESRHYRL